MVNIVIDIGNTLQKLAVFDENGKTVKFLQEKQLSVPILEEVLASYPVQSAIVSSVGKDDEELFRWLGSRIRLIRFSSILTMESERPFRRKLPSSRSSTRSFVANPAGSLM